MDSKLLSSEAITLLSQLIETHRTSRNETKATNLLADFMAKKGLEPHRLENNLWCIAPDYDSTRPTLLLNAHIDTVKPVSAWTRDPFSATLEGDTLYGLGSNDDGASLVSLLQVYQQLSLTPQSYNLIFLASAEEEVSGKNGIELVLPHLPHIDVALVGEPTGMCPAIAEKGLMVLDCTAYGRAGHAARNEGDNAIYHALDDIQWFRSYHFPQQTNLLGPVKVTVTLVNAGTQHNVIPDQCTFVVDVRSNECYSNQEIYEEICKHVRCEVRARSFRLNSSHISINHPIVQQAIKLDRSPFGSPTLSDQALMPFPSLKMGPGESSRSHSADEYIRISEIEEAIELYWKMLNGLSMTQD